MSSPISKRIWLPIILMILFSMITVASVEAAPADQWRSTWRVYGDFVPGKPNIKLEVTVEHKTPFAGWSVYGTQVRRLRCQANGVSFQNDSAVFDGSGRIRCSMPSIRRIVRHMTEGKFVPNRFCNCKGNPLAETETILNPNGTVIDYQNPIFARMVGRRVDMALDATVEPGSSQRTSLVFKVGGKETASVAAPAMAFPNEFTAAYFYDNDLYPAVPGNQPGFNPEFITNGAPVGVEVDPMAKKLRVYNGFTWFYIGFSPTTGESLQGAMVTLDVDPGCYVHG